MSALLDAPWASISAERLSHAVQENGAVIARTVLGARDAEDLSQAIDRSFDAFDRNQPGGEWFTPFEAKSVHLATARDWVRRHGGVFAADSPAALRLLIDIYHRTGVIDWVRDILGEAPVLSSHKTTLRKTTPETESVGWHQDGAFLGQNARVVNIWLALTPCGEHAPSLDIALRRQPALVNTGEEGAIYEWTVSERRAALEAGGIVQPVLEQGDAIVFDHLCLHRTGELENPTKIRKAIEAWFFAPSTLPDFYDAIPV